MTNLIAVVGGGSGNRNTLLGLRNYSEKHPRTLNQKNIFAITSTSDNGGHTGRIIRKEDGTSIPVGDIRQCMTALMPNKDDRDSFDYRVQDGPNAGAVVGNIFIDAEYERCGKNMEKAIENLSKRYGIKAHVYPSTLERTGLYATLQNGYPVEGESEIVKQAMLYNCLIDKINLKPKNIRANPKAIEAILNADKVVLAQGSLYTSLIPNLLVKEIRTALRETKAEVIYVMNIVTQRGETDGFDAKKHLKILERYAGKKVVDKIIVNDSYVPDELIQKYRGEGQKRVLNDLGADKRVVKADLLIRNTPVLRHDPDKLAEIIMKI